MFYDKVRKMKRKNRKLFLVIVRKNLITLFLSLVVVLVVSILGFQIYYENIMIPKETDLVIGAVNSYKDISKVYLNLNNKKNFELSERILLDLYDKYKINGLESVEERIKTVPEKETIKEINYYLIDSGLIINTSNQEDLNVDLKKVDEDFWIYMKKNMTGDGIYISNVSFEFADNEPVIYGIKRIDSDKYFAVGLTLEDELIDRFSADMNDLENGSIIDDVDIFTASFLHLIDDEDELTPDEIRTFRKISISEESIVTKMDNGKYFIYIKWIPENDGFSSSLYTRIIIDLSETLKLKNFIIFLICLGLTMYGLLLTYIEYKNVIKILNPLFKTFKSINNNEEVKIENSDIEEVQEIQKIYLEVLKKREERNIQLLSEKETYKKMAYKDSLTGLLNLHGLKKLLNDLCQKKVPFGIIFVDLDNLKAINDTFGHQIGNRVIINFSNIMKKTIRKFDYVSRVGGDEFLLVLINSDKGTAQTIIDRIKEEVKHPLEINGNNIKYDFYWGIDQVTNCENIDKIIEHADKKMYAQKKTKKIEKD